MGIYRYERRVSLAIDGPEGIKKSKEILPKNKEKLLEYAEYLKATKKSLPRQDKLIRTLKTFATLLGPIPFKKTSKEEMVHVLAKAEDHWKAELSKKGRPGQASDKRASLTGLVPRRRRKFAEKCAHRLPLMVWPSGQEL